MKREWWIGSVLVVVLVASLALSGCTLFHLQTDEGAPVTGSFAIDVAPVGPPADTPVSCTDSDGGNDPYREGVVTVFFADRQDAYADVCEGDSLREYYCDGTMMRNYAKLCAYGCENRVCRNAPPSPPLRIQEAPQQTLVAVPLPSSPVRAVSNTTPPALPPQVIQVSPNPQDTATGGVSQKGFPPSCMNGFKDGKETDADCGGPCTPCAYSRMCKSDADCDISLACNYRNKRCLRTRY